MWSKSVPNLSEIEQSAVELLWLKYVHLGAFRHLEFGQKCIFTISWPPSTHIAQARRISTNSGNARLSYWRLNRWIRLNVPVIESIFTARFPGWFWTSYFSELGERPTSDLEGEGSLSLSLPMHILDLRHVALFPNQSVWGSKIKAQFRTLSM